MKASTYQRINITLPRQTLERIDRIAEEGSRSHLIDEAVNQYLTDRSRTQLHKALKEGAVQRRTRDLEIAREMFDLEDARVGS